MADEKDNPNQEYSQLWWVALLHETEKELKEKWWDAADKIVNRYLDRRGDNSSDTEERKYNMFWANVQIMKSALYATPPKPTVSRQNGDSKDDVARTAALMLQRILDIGVNKDASEMHAAFKYGVDDRLIPGSGQVWLRYDATFEPTPAVLDPLTGTELAPAGEKISSESAPCDYVHWRDFIWSPARTWEEVWWVARRVWMKKKAFVKRFGQEKYDELKSNYTNHRANGSPEDGLPKGFAKGRVEVYEVWCEDTNKVYWINQFARDILETVDDPLKLDDFFPCPKPLLATHTTNTIIPRADYTMVQDQYGELDTLNDRISVLTEALRVVGVYDKNQVELSKMLSGKEFQMIAVDNWAMLAEKGGLKGCVDWFPVEVIAGVLEKLMIQRVALVGQIYELTSISDIMRGASNGRETAKAQTLKAQYSSVRLQLTQQDVARWVAHAMMIKAEIVARHFQPKSIIEQSQIMQTESSQFAQPAVELIKNFEKAQYRIEVGEESLSLADYNAERELRTQYITSVGQFLSQAGSIMEFAPQALPYLLKMVQWVTASFRGSSDIESVLDEAVALASKPQPEKTDPAEARAAAAEQSKMQIAQMNLEAKAASDSLAMQMNKDKIESQERIAQWNNSTKILLEKMQEQVEQMNASMTEDRETRNMEMKDMLERAKMAQGAIEMLMQHHAQQQESAAQRDHEATEAANQREAEEAAAAADAPAKPDPQALLVEAIAKLSESIGKPRVKKVTKRNPKTNDIEEVTET